MGWVSVRRDHGKIIFIDLRDRSGAAQVVFTPADKKVYDLAQQLRSEWAIAIKGKINRRPKGMENPKLETGEFEILAEELIVLAQSEELPFDLDSEIALETFLDWQPLVLRTEKNRNIFRIQAEIVWAFREFLKNKGFTEIQIPKIVAQATEGGANVFKLDYFERSAYLAQSPQFYKQIMVGVFERVFTVGNVYRAEEHSTTRHLNEYTSLDFETGFINNHADIMTLENEMLIYIVNHLSKNCAKEFEFFGLKSPKISEAIPSLKLVDAQKILKEKYGIDCLGEPDLDPQGERKICEYAKENFDSDFIFITHYPAEKRPFYTHPDPAEPSLTRSFDLLFRGVEISTGGQRIHNYSMLVESIEKRGLNPENFSFYLQAFKYGMPPEGGAGIGLERLTQKFLNLENIREATLFPRDLHRIDILLSSIKNEKIKNE
ncbi:MAG: Aspartyl-tRNA synthetase [Candidatus Curtissbacteria bacterium GW2011_GWA1_40_24]|uniref:Aspartate--tRNA ligase n=2 Tax=Patescibacteria group TaxID=1783273 RepID=A0A0G0U899_9BACT|nr:MAG: Aspartyl-tRNA synthetase [Candidatus Curtissbacteria bacterium GW2011_GWA1_40_24]KKR89030.1 MAG: Aspartyl-tRNA synthetase [Candidatus Wolfebacteria bacterium GW2011_GWB1_41_12]